LVAEYNHKQNIPNNGYDPEIDNHESCTVPTSQKYMTFPDQLTVLGKVMPRGGPSIGHGITAAKRWN
jgi:hypothetical protein